MYVCVRACMCMCVCARVCACLGACMSAFFTEAGSLDQTQSSVRASLARQLALGISSLLSEAGVTGRRH